MREQQRETSRERAAERDQLSSEREQLSSRERAAERDQQREISREQGGSSRERSVEQ